MTTPLSALFLLAGLLIPATRAAARPAARPDHVDAIHVA